LPHHVACGDTQFPQSSAQAVFRGRRPERVERAERRQVGRTLQALDAATRPEQLNLAGFYLHTLQGEARWKLADHLWLGWR